MIDRVADSDSMRDGLGIPLTLTLTLTLMIQDSGPSNHRTMFRFSKLKLIGFGGMGMVPIRSFPCILIPCIKIIYKLSFSVYKDRSSLSCIYSAITKIPLYLDGQFMCASVCVCVCV